MEYENLAKHLKDKNLYVTDLCSHLFNMTNAMFNYKNLPDEIPQTKLEYQLQKFGSVGFFKYNEKMYALNGSVSKRDAYNEPLEYRITNSFLNLSKNFVIGENLALVGNDSLYTPLVALIAKYAVMMCDTELSLDTIAVLARMTMLITASDDSSKQAADEYVKKIMNGDFSVIGDNEFLGGVKLSNTSTNSLTRIKDVIELLQYLKASLFNELGLQSNWNAKRETLNENEIGMNVDILLPYADTMLKMRKKGLETVNTLFDTNIQVEFNSAWKTTHNEESTADESTQPDTDVHDQTEQTEPTEQDSDNEN